ncbi:hypothetical protein KFK09_025812 [Dendrobium nobile]|uniref:Uncharacterized protein n=1 Tax=Dendrobium nobile TaxID=94219 RepID=A0A8T3A6X7_DENNO|nr:hypothetical protein KFK09_025812 [Dendrobium nobile]
MLPTERQIVRYLLTGEQCNANISIALLTNAIFLSQPDLPKKHVKEEKDGYLRRNAQNGVRLEVNHDIF